MKYKLHGTVMWCFNFEKGWLRIGNLLVRWNDCDNLIFGIYWL